MLVDQYETVLLDLDGVVVVGDSAVPGAAASIRALRDRGRRVRFVTNNSRSSRETIARRLREHGIEARPAAVVSAGWATAEHVGASGADSAYVIGTAAVAEMVRERGVAVRERDVDAVVVGHDDTVTYDDIKRATRLIRSGADFVAANTDGWFPASDGVAPGTGAITAAIEAATAVAPTVVGKPEPLLFELALDGAAPGSALMVGDNPCSDVGGAARAGVDAVLVTGDDHRDHEASGDDRRDHEASEPVARVADLTDLFATDPRDAGGSD